MGQKIKLYKCVAMTTGDNELIMFSNTGIIIREYVFANSKAEAIDIFNNRYKQSVSLKVSEIKISPGLVIYKNKYNYTIDDNELSLSMERSDNT